MEVSVTHGCRWIRELLQTPNRITKKIIKKEEKVEKCKNHFASLFIFWEKIKEKPRKFIVSNVIFLFRPPAHRESHIIPHTHTHTLSVFVSVCNSNRWKRLLVGFLGCVEIFLGLSVCKEIILCVSSFFFENRVEKVFFHRRYGCAYLYYVQNTNQQFHTNFNVILYFSVCSA